MQQTLKLVVILLMPLLTQKAFCQTTNRVQPQTINQSVPTGEFSLVEYLRENPEEANIRYQAYLRVRLAASDDSLQQKLYAETLKIKSELAQNTTDYSKLVHKAAPLAKQKETANKELAKKDDRENPKVVVN